MAIIEALTLTIGSAVAKVVFSFWLNEPDLQADAVSGIVDSIRSMTGDLLAARNANRHFEKISEKAAELLQNLYEIEYRSWTEDQFEAIALNAADAIRNAQITPALLASRNLDPIELQRFILKISKSYERDLSQDEVALYKRLVHKSCELIIDFSAELPNFTQRTLSEVLKREETIIQIITDTAERVKRLQESSYHPSIGGMDSRYFRNTYKSTVIRKLDWMELYGSDLSGESTRHKLNVAYIHLSVRKSHTGSSESDIILPVDKAIQDTRHLFIRGAAGSGKTTLLKWIAVKSAEESFDGGLASWNGSIPFLIRLRQCVETNLPRPEEFPAMIAPNIAGTTPLRWVHNLLEDGDAIVLIDGVDEISRRKEVQEWIEDLVHTFNKSRFIVTSRPLASADAWETPEGFTEAELLPMELPDITTFIKYWHNAVEAEMQASEENPDLEILADDLIDTVSRNQSIRLLASTPLLCAMICALHKDKHRNLPQNRLELYEACTKMLLEEREKAREIHIDEYPRLEYKEQFTILSNLSYFLLKNGYSEIANGRAKDRIAEALKNLPNIPTKTTPNKILAFFVERTGMIFEPVHDKIAFIHRTFQEYLAAHAAIDSDEIGVLLEHATDPLWREVIILAAGLANKTQRDELLGDLLTSARYTESERSAIDLLAVACTETVTNLEPEFRNALRERAKSLIPPKSLSDAKVLAQAGELAVPYLSFEKCTSAPEMCIKTLELIKTRSALQTLVGYLASKDSIVISALVASLGKINEDEYGNNLLDELHVTELEVRDVVPIEILDHIRSIHSLTIIGYDGTDLSRLQNQHLLQKLVIRKCDQLELLETLEHLGNLRELEITGCPSIHNLKFILRISGLKSLKLVNLNIESVDELGSLKALDELEINDLPVEGLPRFDGLKTLKLLNCPRLSDLTKIGRDMSVFSDSGFSSADIGGSGQYLERVIIGACPQIFSLDALEKFKHIRTIEIWKYPSDTHDITIPKKIKHKVIVHEVT